MPPIQWQDQTLHLLPDRALRWPRPDLATSPNGGGGVLVVADLHVGKTAAFRAAGIRVPEVVDADLDDLSSLIARERPDVLLIAGDLFHARSGCAELVMASLRRWRVRHAELEVILVRGNHDRNAGDPPAELDIRVEDEPFSLRRGDPIAFAHNPAAMRPDDVPVICGHLHPSVTLGDGLTALNAPCFWVRTQYLVLPARGRFTGTRGIRPAPADRVFMVCDREVIEARPHASKATVVRPRRRARAK